MLGGMSLFAVSAIGRDRPGIVAAVSRVLLDLEGNVEDSQMSILRGHFAVMLIVALPSGVDGAGSSQPSSACCSTAPGDAEPLRCHSARVASAGAVDDAPVSRPSTTPATIRAR